MAGAVSAAQPGLSGGDKKFFNEAAGGGVMEVQLGQIAQQKAQSQEVKDFGTRMVNDHGEANEELKQLARQKNQKLPGRLESKQMKLVDKLSKLSGADFDKEYMEVMVKDHARDVSDFRNVGTKAKDPDLNAWAGKTLAVLEDHLKQARNVAQKLGVDVNKAEQEGTQEAHKTR